MYSIAQQKLCKDTFKLATATDIDSISTARPEIAAQTNVWAIGNKGNAYIRIEGVSGTKSFMDLCVFAAPCVARDTQRCN